MNDRSVTDHLNSEALYKQVLDLVADAVEKREYNTDDFRRALDSVISYGKIIGYRCTNPFADPDNDDLLRRWMEIAEADTR
jgi:hypothetical protein